MLNGSLPGDLGTQSVHDMERYCLARADQLIWQGGDMLGTYRRFYGAAELAPEVRIRYPYRGPIALDGRRLVGRRFLRAGRPLRLLYAGRIERRKGIHNLIRAMRRLPGDAVPPDDPRRRHDQGPLGLSMVGPDRPAGGRAGQVRLGDALDREALATAIRAHDAVVIPSQWECWPYAALEPLHLNRPVLGTPVGGLVEMLERGGGLADPGHRSPGR